jgi:hypothetical protein
VNGWPATGADLQRIEFHCDTTSIQPFVIPSAPFGARNLHFRNSKQLQIPRYAGNDNQVEMSQYCATLTRMISGRIYGGSSLSRGVPSLAAWPAAGVPGSQFEGRDILRREYR